ncbi:AraC-like ligand-binding domain-containing protein [Streptomyces roseolus]|uniref:AraC-like ligand-binding domain-containing protein n=1 Tax=Streptomyces roseolus TaxID=67358 RepID=UPI003798FA44
MSEVTTISTASVGARDAFEWWSQVIGDTVMPVTTASPYADRFRGTATAVRLTDTEFSDFAFSPMAARRAAAHIRHGDPEQYFLLLVHGSPIGIEQRRNNTLLTSGEMTLFDTSHPLSCEFQDDGRLSHVSLLRLPRATLPVPQDGVDRLLGTTLSARTGSGALLSSYLTGLRAETGRCDPEELSRLGAVALALSETFLTALTNSTVPATHETRHHVLLTRVRAFIEANLADPDLRPASIAAYHHISLRTLHALFRQEPTTVAATIRHRRLERCRADLADPRMRDRPIAVLAARWGFLIPAEFSRAFRAVYGMSPSEWRSESVRPTNPCGSTGRPGSR